jgi:adenosylcobinamide-GDP ribazoletransferase
VEAHLHEDPDMTGLAGAVVFLTRVPLRVRTVPPVAACVPWFPVVGALIGLAVGGVAVGLAEIVPLAVAAMVAVLVGVLVTGAFHEDGLADVADALVGGWDVEQRLRILKDPRHGTYGVAALCGSIVLRVVALGSLAPRDMFIGAVAAHTLARTAAVGWMLGAPTARHDGLGADYVRSLRRLPALAGIVGGLAITTIGLALVATWWWVLPLVGLTLGATGVLVLWARRRIGGVTGDVLGAVEQVGEMTVLVTLTALAV